MMVSVGQQLISALRALVEIAGMFLLAQGALFVLAGGRHESNAVFRLCRVITRPLIGATRRLMPGAISDRRLPLVAFFLLFGLWIFLAYVRQRV